MKSFAYAVVSILTLVTSVFAQAQTEPSATYSCHEIERNNRQTRPVRGGLKMVVSAFGEGADEGEPFKVNVRVGSASRGEIFDANVKGTQEDVVFHFAGIEKNKAKIAGVIYFDELDQTSVRIHLKDGERIKAYFDCE